MSNNKVESRCVIDTQRQSPNERYRSTSNSLEDEDAAQVELLPGWSSGVSINYDYKLLAEVLTQLRAKSTERGDEELNELLQKVRIVVPLKSLIEEYPGAYALPPDPTNQEHLVLIESRWLNQVAGFAELGALYALPWYGDPWPSFANDIFNQFCQRYQAIYKEAVQKNQPLPVYQFDFEDFFSRSNPEFGVDFLIFDKLSGVVLTNTWVWTVLHEVGHHALKHTSTLDASNQASRQRELAADKWAFNRMKDLGYSFIGVGSYLVARAMTDFCFGQLGLVVIEGNSTHPTWEKRDTALRINFDVFAVPPQEIHIFCIPMGIPEPVLTTITIPGSNSPECDATIIQRNQVLYGMVEWEGKTATVYAREAAGGRVEFIVKDAMDVAPFIEQRIYDQDNLLVQTLNLPAVPQEVVGFDFLEIGCVKFSDIRKRITEQNLMVEHLQRVRASESAIRQALALSVQFNDERRFFGLQYVKGNINFTALTEQIQKKASIYEKGLIKILGEDRYRAFVKAYGDEVKKFTPPMTGVDAWEDKLFKENFGECGGVD